MKKWIKVILIVILVIVLLIVSTYAYVEISYNKSFSENGMKYNCCPCEGMEMYAVCCDCKVPSTFLEKVNYLNMVNSMR